MENSYRDVLRKVTAKIVRDEGFSSATEGAIETLVEMLESLLKSLAQSTRDYTELARRTQPTVGDVTMAFIDNGVEFDYLEHYVKTSKKFTIHLRENKQNKPQMPLLRFHPLPKKHTYIRTSAFSKPPTNYKELRSKSADSKRGIEAALSKYYARISNEKVNLFEDEEGSNFLIASGTETSSTPSYLSALMPTDQIFDHDELEYYYQLRNAKIEEEAAPCERLEALVSEPLEYDVSPKREDPEIDINANEILPTSQPKLDSSDKPEYENPFLKLIKH